MCAFGRAWPLALAQAVAGAPFDSGDRDHHHAPAAALHFMCSMGRPKPAFARIIFLVSRAFRDR